MFTVTTKVDPPGLGILYLLEIDLDERSIIKIGITNRKIESRVCDILTSIFKSYRYFPKIYPKRFSKVEDNFGKEQMLLSYLSEYKYKSEMPFGGCTELVEMDLDLAVQVYEKVKNGIDLVKNEELCETCNKAKNFEVEGRACCGHGH